MVSRRVHAGRRAHRFDEVDGAAHIGVERGFWVFVGRPDERLRRQMKGDLRLEIGKCLLERGQLAHVTPHVLQALGKSEHLEIRRLRRYV